MRPSTSLATLRPDLSGSMEEFDLDMNMAGMIGLRLAPALEVAKKSGSFGILPLEELLKNRETRRSSGAPYSRGTGKFEDMDYACEEHGTEEPVDDQEAEMYRDYFNAEQVAAKRARHIVMRAYETRIVTLANAVSTTTAAGTAWTDVDNCDPVANVRAAKLAIQERTGLIPNCLVISWNRLQYLKDAAAVVDKIKNVKDVSTKNLNAAVLAGIFDVEEVLVSGARYNSANEGQAASLASTWSDNVALLCRKAVTNDHREPCFLRTMHWSADGSQVGGVFETYRDETVRGDVVRNRMDTDELVIYAAAAQKITGV